MTTKVYPASARPRQTGEVPLAELTAAWTGAQQRREQLPQAVAPARPRFNRPRRSKLSDEQIAAEIKTLNDEQAAKIFAQRVKDSGLPKTLLAADRFDGLSLPEDARAVWTAARSLLGEFAGTHCIVALIGQQGTGKSTAAASVVLAELRAERPARYVTGWEYLDRIDAARKFSAATTPAKVEELFMRAPTLVIDEFHAHQPGEFQTLAMQRLIARRWDEGLCTIILSNDLPNTFAPRVGPSIVSRMHESGASFVFEFADLRKRT